MRSSRSSGQRAGKVLRRRRRARRRRPRAGRRSASSRSCAAQAPVVEVAGDDQRRVGRHLAVDQLAQQRRSCCWRCDSRRPRCTQIACTCCRLARHVEHAVQQAALLVAGDRHVVVRVVRIGNFDSTRVAVVAVRIHRVAAVGELRSRCVSARNSYCGVAGQSVKRLRVVRVRAEHLLQEHDVGADRAHRLAQLVQDEAAVEEAEALVGVDGEHAKTRAMTWWTRNRQSLCRGRRAEAVGSRPDLACAFAYTGYARP